MAVPVKKSEYIVLNVMEEMEDVVALGVPQVEAQAPQVALPVNPLLEMGTSRG